LSLRYADYVITLRYMLSPCHYYAAFADISIAEFIRVGRHFATTLRFRRRFDFIRRDTPMPPPIFRWIRHIRHYDCISRFIFTPMPLRRFSPPPLSAFAICLRCAYCCLMLPYPAAARRDGSACGCAMSAASPLIALFFADADA
jgi:hypothetical protein